MKVLHIIPSLATGGAEKLVIETLPLLNQRGIKTDILLFDGTEYPFLKVLRDLNCCNIFSLGKKSVYNPIFIFRIIPYLSKYDLIHAHLFSAQYFVAIAKSLSLSKTPIIITEHSTKNRRIINPIFKIPELLVYAKYRKIICITDEVKEVLKKHIKANNDKLITIKNGIDFRKFINPPRILRTSINANIKDDDFVIIQIAGFRKEKDHETIIRSISILPVNFKLLLVGDGITIDRCRQLVAKLGLSNRVIFLGARYDVTSLLAIADIVVLSTHYEGFGLVAIEGMASGKPFIGSDVPGLREVVNNAGILVAPQNHIKMAKSILKLQSDKEYYNKVSQRCLSKAKIYDIDKMVNKTIELYNSVLIS